MFWRIDITPYTLFNASKYPNHSIEEIELIGKIKLNRFSTHNSYVIKLNSTIPLNSKNTSYNPYLYSMAVFLLQLQATTFV